MTADRVVAATASQVEPKDPVVLLKATLEVQKLQRFTSEILWHFYGRGKPPEERYNTLLSILRTGLRCGPEPAPFIWLAHDAKTKSLNPVKLESLPYCSIADIPLKDLPVHAERYGQYAIGFHRESVIRHGFVPVMYVNQMAPEFHRFMYLMEAIDSALLSRAPDIAKQFSDLRYLLGSVVQGGLLQVAPSSDVSLEKAQISSFYYEREWRSLRDWLFSGVDVAAVIVPDDTLDQLLKLQAQRDLRISPKTLLMGFSSVYRF